jgi:hypothetical protein
MTLAAALRMTPAEGRSFADRFLAQRGVVNSDGAAKCESRWFIVSVVADVSVVTDVADVAAKFESGWLRVVRVAGVVGGKGREGAASWRFG